MKNKLLYGVLLTALLVVFAVLVILKGTKPGMISASPSPSGAAAALPPVLLTEPPVPTAAPFAESQVTITEEPIIINDPIIDDEPIIVEGSAYNGGDDLPPEVEDDSGTSIECIGSETDDYVLGENDTPILEDSDD